MNKKCGISNDLLVDYIYGEIKDGAGRATVEGHIKGCDECAQELKKLEAVKAAAKSLEVDFSGDVWAIQRQGVIRKLRRKENAWKGILENLMLVLNARTLGVAVLIMLFAGVGVQYYRYTKAVTHQKEIAEKMELLDNIEIIERLDFYEKLSRK